MKRCFLIISLFCLLFGAFAQQIEPARHEVKRWSKDQGCHFESFGNQGGMMVYQTEKMDEQKNVMWDFVLLDTNLYERRSDLIPLSSKMSFVESASDAHYATFLFTSDKTRKSDTISFCVVCFNRRDNTYKSFGELLPEKTLILSTAVMDGVMTMAVNDRSGSGFLLFFDLESGSARTVKPSLQNGYVLFQLTASPQEHCFVVTAREYENKHYKATTFLAYSQTGNVLRSYRFENGENATLGRMCLDFDEEHRLVVMSTLERESTRKVRLEGVVDGFDKIAVGVVWLRFGTTTDVRSYLFKNMPDIERALRPSDRVRVREERIKLDKNSQKEKKEVAFQFLQPRMLRFGDLLVFAAEAFVPEYHTETRMNYGFYGMYPYSYTVFDGYDFISEILLAFDKEGNLKWQTSACFENELTYDLTRHAGEAVCHNELVLASPCKNKLRYVVFDAEGHLLLSPQTEPVATLFGADFVEDEYFAEIDRWYGSRFLVFGSQIIQNGVLSQPRRAVYFLQKVQYE